MPREIIISNHAIKRIMERTDLKIINDDLLKNIYFKGLSLRNTKGIFKKYIRTITDNKSIVKVYDNYLFIFTNNSCYTAVLKTVIPISDKFKNKSHLYIKNDSNKPIMINF